MKNFSGIGLVIYQSRILSKNIHHETRPQTPYPRNLKLTDKSFFDFLLEISSTSHSLHDGFHFINQKSELTHVAQYFAPPKAEGVKPDYSHGIRFWSAQHGSLAEGVITIGTVSQNHEPYCFIKGEAIKL